LHADAVAVFIAKFVSGSLAFHLGKPGLYFSAYVLLLFAGSLIFYKKTRPAYNNLLLYLSLFLFLMIASIAAARTLFNPNVWAAARFQTTVLLFILCLHIHACLSIPLLTQHTRATVFKIILGLHGFLVFFMLQYFTYNLSYKLSNTVFFSQAYMLAHERNQHNAPRLLLWLHDEDVIADSDPFFRKNGFAWYANKMATEKNSTDNSPHRGFIDVGKPFIRADDVVDFQKSCATVLAPLTYHWTPDGGIEFATPLRDHPLALLHRKTYYAIDKNGLVAGAAYVVVNEDKVVKHASLEGYSVSYDLAYFAENDDAGNPRCLYSVVQEK